MPISLLSMVPWGKLIMAALFAAMGAFIAHKADTLYYTAKVSHVEAQLAQAKEAHEKAVRDALIWATEKQRSYDDAAIQTAQRDTARQQVLAADSDARVRALQGIQPRTLVRGCITYEFVRHLDAAIIAAGAASTLPIPAGKSNDSCAPVDAVAVERWLLGIIASHQMNAQQLGDLQSFIRQAQALR